ncbi:MAG: diacylglycerol kinase family lipid kinase [Acetatifactor sp.]|nr:diacylglycerol kinase family lipid kinase [Acetatifactor sp.]
MYHIVINPASRSGKGLKLWKEKLEPMLVREKIEYKSYFSKEDGHMTELVASITENASDLYEPLRLIVMGGDGTLNQALNGIVHPENVILGYVPTGSSNDFARDMKIPSKPEDALKLILREGRPVKYDYGVVTFPDGTSRRYIGSSGIGFDAATCEAVEHSATKEKLNKFKLGKLVYLAVALQQLFGAKTGEAKMILNDTETILLKGLFFSACMVHRYEGGGFMFCPDADATDGLLDICCVDDLPKLKILTALPTAFKGNHYRFNGIDAYKAKKVTIQTSVPLWVHTDGEVLRTTTEATFENCHDGIYIVTP